MMIIKVFELQILVLPKTLDGMTMDPRNFTNILGAIIVIAATCWLVLMTMKHLVLEILWQLEASSIATSYTRYGFVIWTTQVEKRIHESVVFPEQYSLLYKYQHGDRIIQKSIRIPFHVYRIMGGEEQLLVLPGNKESGYPKMIIDEILSKSILWFMIVRIIAIIILLMVDILIIKIYLWDPWGYFSIGSLMACAQMFYAWLACQNEIDFRRHLIFTEDPMSTS